MTEPDCRAHVVDVSGSGTILEVSAWGDTRRVETPAIHPQLADALVEACGVAASLDDALAAWNKSVEQFVPQSLSALGGVRAVVDAASEVSADQVLAWARLLARVIEPDQTSVIVCGNVTVSPDSDYNTLGSAAAAVIRLRLGLFIGVGTPVKAFATQVGLEGSWDGESVWVETPTQAYDYLVGQLTEGDIVVVTGLGESAARECVGIVSGDAL
jgi:UDP-N-acetylmuramoyl-tripeptide--D-alanyl-D-alanine ligase